VKISKNKIYTAVVIIAVLIAAYILGGGFAKSSPSSDLEKNTNIKAEQNVEERTENKDKEEQKSTEEAIAVAQQQEQTTESGSENSSQEKNETKAVNQKSVAYSESKGMQIDPKTGKDKYRTEPVPEGKPIPVEPGSVKVTKNAKTCTMSIECKTIVDNLASLNKEKVELVPEDGIIMPATEVTFYEGESVFNLLQRETKRNKIHMEFSNTPIYNSAYIEGINNLYEFDCGELSGWMYKVNGWFPNYGCSRYVIKEGDIIEWIYTCDLGRDIGGGLNEQ